MKLLLYVLLNTVSLLAVILINYLSNTGITGSTVGEISRQYDSLIVPSGYAFSIWGLIYLLLIAFVAFQWRCLAKRSDTEVILQTGIWFFFTNLCNGAWVWFWLNEKIDISVMLMGVLLLSLLILMKRLRLEVYDAPVRIIAFVWWPICIYLGWIVIASVANVAAFLVSIGWKGGIFSEAQWTILMIIASVGIYSMLVFKRNMREASMVGAWAYVAIAVRQWNVHPSIAIVTIIAAVLLILYCGLHAYINRATLPVWRSRKGMN